MTRAPEALAADRRAAANWARRMLERPLAILDTETTGLADYDEVLEVAIVDERGRTLLDTLVKPTVPSSDRAEATHGITADDVAAAPTIAQVHPLIVRAVRGRTVVVYNKQFDAARLDASLRARKIMPHYNRAAESWECAMAMYAAFVGEWSQSRRAYRWQPLPQGDHRARGDALATLALLQRMAQAARGGQP